MYMVRVKRVLKHSKKWTVHVLVLNNMSQMATLKWCQNMLYVAPFFVFNNNSFKKILCSLYIFFEYSINYSTMNLVHYYKSNALIKRELTDSR